MAIDSAVEDGLTPVMRQHRAAKEAHPDALLFFRMGDFYELFYDDAVIAARELQLMLTSRDKSKTVPMCGVPYHSAGPYLQRLLRKGYRVALCEQMEDPKTTKTIVRREVTRVLTPGTAVDSALDPSESQWLASCVGVKLAAGVCDRPFDGGVSRNRVHGCDGVGAGDGRAGEDAGSRGSVCAWKRVWDDQPECAAGRVGDSGRIAPRS
jgi:hypothetical protein